MAETGGMTTERQLTVRHRGRIAQIGIFFWKFLRTFIYQSDWKVLPMAALIAGLVGFALGGDFRVTREGTLTGAFSIICVCIWNGSFNSIQVICRERDVVKREHRSGMHISSYILAHMMYQLILCALQTIVTLIVLDLVGMKFLGEGLFTPWLALDAGITMFLTTYAADLMSLWISSLVHSTTTAMTIMPFLLIFQLIFSGGFFALPSVVEPITLLTISNPGLKAMAAQAQINDLPYATIGDMLNLVEDVEFGGNVTVGQIVEALQDKSNKTIAELRAIQIGEVKTIRELGEEFLKDDRYAKERSELLIGDMTVGDLVSALLNVEFLDGVFETEVGFATTFGDVVDYLSTNEIVRYYWDESFTIKTTLGDVLDLVGREETKAMIKSKAAEKLYEPEYAFTSETVIKNWIHLLIFVVVFAVLSIITLEFIDKDKR